MNNINKYRPRTINVDDRAFDYRNNQAVRFNNTSTNYKTSGLQTAKHEQLEELKQKGSNYFSKQMIKSIIE